MSGPCRVLVIGGGITGLASAYRLKRQFEVWRHPLELSLLEASSHLGGSIRTNSKEGFILERGPDCFISEKPRGIALCEELGLMEELIGTRTDKRRSFIIRQGKFHPVPEGFYLMGPAKTRPFLESGLLSWPGKLRVLSEALLPGRAKTDESLGSFVRRRFGQELLDWMADPLVAGIYGASPEDLSLRATFPQFLEMERKYGSVLVGLKKRVGAVHSASGARYSLFVSLRHGMQTLTDKLASSISSSCIKLNTGVRSLELKGETWQITLAAGDILTADALCLALPSYACAELLKSVDKELAQDLAAISYAPAATLHFCFRAEDISGLPDGIGFVVPRKEGRLILGCTLVQNKFEGRVPEGHVLLRTFLGGSRGEWTTYPEDQLEQKVLEELKGWFSIKGAPRFTTRARFKEALPQYAVGHLPRVLRMEERVLHHPGLALAGNWQYGVGIPDCIASGERAAEHLVIYLKRRAPAFS